MPQSLASQDINVRRKSFCLSFGHWEATSARFVRAPPYGKKGVSDQLTDPPTKANVYDHVECRSQSSELTPIDFLRVYGFARGGGRPPPPPPG